MDKISEKFNIMVIGDEMVGKSTILERHFNKKFNSERKKTIGVDYFNKTHQVDNKQYQIKFWDTAGQEKFRSVTRNYYQRANGMIITMAIDNRNSFNNLKMWVNSVHEHSNNRSMPIVIACNKTDLKEGRTVDNKEVESFCNKENIKYYFTSAKENINIDESFDYIIDEVITNSNNNSNNKGQMLSDVDSGQSSNSGCKC